MIGSQQGLPQDPANTVTSGHQSDVNRLTTNTPHKFLILSVRAWAILKRSSRTILKSVRSWQAVVFRGAPVDLIPWFQASSGSLRQEEAINVLSGHTNPTSNVALMHALKGQRKDFMPYANRCGMGHCLENPFLVVPPPLECSGGFAKLLSLYNRGFALFISCKFQTIGIEAINGTSISLCVIWLGQP